MQVVTVGMRCLTGGMKVVKNEGSVPLRSMNSGNTTMKLQSGKSARKQAIHEIMNRGAGSSQEDIRVYLRGRGIHASQATLSRDLREMGAVKIPVNGGRSVYRLHTASQDAERRMSDYNVSFESIGNLLIIKTSSGRAPGLCVVIDSLGLNEVAGTVAGDDTIIAVLRNANDATSVIGKLEQTQ